MIINFFKKNIGLKISFFLSLFFTWALIQFFKSPVDVNDNFIELGLKLNGIKVSKTEGIEYSHFNNCSADQDCSCKVIVHGIGDNFLNWANILQEIKKQDKVKGHWVAFNYPGTGESDPFADKNDFRVNRFSAIMNNKMKKICNGPYDLIAGSMGTWMSFWWTIQFPEDIKSMLLLNAVGAYADYTWMADAMVNPSTGKLRQLYKKAYHNSHWWPERVYLNTLKNVKKRKNKQFILSQDRTLAVDEYLPKINQKTFIIWGESDQLLPISTYHTYLEKMPNVKGKIVKNCGHMPNYECPEEVIKVINQFYNTSSTQ